MEIKKKKITQKKSNRCIRNRHVLGHGALVSEHEELRLRRHKMAD